MASDGLWDIITSNEACGFVKKFMEDTTIINKIL